MDSVLSLNHVEKKFDTHKGAKEAEKIKSAEITVLSDIQFSLKAGEMVALTGASGTGKTTLLQIMGLLDVPTRGKVTIKGEEFSSFPSRNSKKRRDLCRRNFLGFVYQYHYLLPELTALENVILPQRIVGESLNKAKERAAHLLQEFGLAHRFDHTLHKLSGGEQQRVAIARALVNDPEILLADEPTGNLDDQTAQQVFSLLVDLAQTRHIAMVIATHNMDLAKKMSRHIRLHQGKLEESS